MTDNKKSARDRELLRGRLTAQLSDRQRQLSEISDKAARCESIVRECREELELGHDKAHVHWAIPALLLAAGGSFLAAFGSKFLAILCYVGALIFFGRWIAAFSHSLRKYGRINQRLRHHISECDRLADKSSTLRLETLELRQKLEQLEREERV